LKNYKILIEEISGDNNQKVSGKFNKDNMFNRIEKERLVDRTLYDLTSINECLVVSMHEYDTERGKSKVLITGQD